MWSKIYMYEVILWIKFLLENKIIHTLEANVAELILLNMAWKRNKN